MKQLNVVWAVILALALSASVRCEAAGPAKKKVSAVKIYDASNEPAEMPYFGIVNLKDAPMLPNSIVRAMIRKKVKQTGAAIYTDPDRILSKAWDLGDCNDQFVLLFVTKDGEVEFMSKGEMTQQQIDEFYRVIDKYR